MRIKTFPLRERVVLIPMELVSAMKWALVLFAALFILSGLLGSGALLVERRPAHGSLHCCGTGCRGTLRWGPDSDLSALAPGPGLFPEGHVAGSPARPCAVFLPVESCGGFPWTPGGTGLAAADPRACKLSGHEFYRRLNLYLAFRCEEGDAVGPAAPDRGRGRGTRPLGHVPTDRMTRSHGHEPFHVS